MMEMQEYGNQSSKIVLIQMVDDHDLEFIEKELLLICEKTNLDFLLRVFKVKNWNIDLSPWKSSAVFGKEDFSAGAGETLKEVLASCSDTARTYYIGGYSLAGLFALWSAYQTDLFKGVAAASQLITDNSGHVITPSNPYPFIHHLKRINFAKYHLQNGNLSIKKIAFLSGFNSESGFCATFRKREGITPTEYRENLKN